MRPPAVADGVCSAHRIGGPARNRQSTIRSADLIVDLETRVVLSGDKLVPLTGKEYCIFELLSLRKGIVVTKQVLLDHLYGGIDEPELKIIDVFVCHLRKKLAQATGGKHCIETIWGRGYRVRDPGQVPPLPDPCETEDDPDRSSAGSRTVEGGPAFSRPWRVEAD
jgi:DNA-binding response OmpR family regulator